MKKQGLVLNRANIARGKRYLRACGVKPASLGLLEEIGAEMAPKRIVDLFWSTMPALAGKAFFGVEELRVNRLPVGDLTRQQVLHAIGRAGGLAVCQQDPFSENGYVLITPKGVEVASWTDGVPE